MTYAVAKLNKRLHIVNDGVVVYTPPNFLKLPNRDALAALAAAFDEQGYVGGDVLTTFERRFSTRNPSVT